MNAEKASDSSPETVTNADQTIGETEANDQAQASAESQVDAMHDTDGQSTVELNNVETQEEVAEGDELAAAQAEIATLKDAFLRAKAEQDNVRRRADKDIANSRKFAVEGFAKELLAVYDSLKLATAVEIADDAGDSVKSVREGVEITLKQLNTAFAKFALNEIAPAVGDKLDPNLHQAMSLIESDDVDSGCIISVIQAGFELHERLLRPAMVVVAK